MEKALVVFDVETLKSLVNWIGDKGNFQYVRVLMQVQLNAVTDPNAPVMVAIPKDGAIELFKVLATVPDQADAFRSLAQALATPPPSPDPE